MNAKRFTMCYEQNDINGWTMSIVDWQTEQPFDYTTYEVHSESITDTKDEMEDLCLLLNELNDENEQLKQSIKEIDDAELHLKQIILKRIDDYIWEWEDEGTPVAQVLRELRDEIKGDDVE